MLKAVIIEVLGSIEGCCASWFTKSSTIHRFVFLENETQLLCMYQLGRVTMFKLLYAELGANLVTFLSFVRLPSTQSRQENASYILFSNYKNSKDKVMQELQICTVTTRRLGATV